MKIDFHTKSIQGKIIALFLIAAISIVLAWIISDVAFRKVVNTIEDVTQPNDKLRILNTLSYSITEINHLQKKSILENVSNPDSIQRPQFQQILLTLDTLRGLSIKNDLQLQRIDSMETIINQYEILLSGYLELYKELVDNRNLSKKLKLLSMSIFEIRQEKDSSIITTEKKIITTTVLNDSSLEQEETVVNGSEYNLLDSLNLKNSDKNQPSRKKIFGKKKAEKEIEPEPQIPTLTTVEEESNVRIDTLTIAANEDLLKRLEKSIRKIRQYQQDVGEKLLNLDLSLVYYSDEYIHQLRSLLKSIEYEEIRLINTNNTVLISTMNESMHRITFVLVLFVVIMSTLVFFLFTDISRSNMYRKQLLEAKEHAEYLSAVKQRFLSNMSHEIRTPLQSIIGFSEQMQQQENPKKEDVRAIYRSSEHLLQIVNEVLDYSRIVSGKFTFEKKEFSMYDLLDEVTEVMRLQASKKNILFVFNSNVPPEINCYGDAFRLRQILYNLLGNAIKFTNKGSVTFDIVMKEVVDSTVFSFEISDTGIGISEDDLKRIFHEFEQAESNIPGKGTGLGLSISRSLIEQQGGKIEVKSALNVGSVFTFETAYDTTLNQHALILETEDNETPTIGINGKVLVVDDDPFILKLCEAILRKNHISHCCYSSPLDLLNSEIDDSVVLILTDMRMPEMTGLELCEALRKKDKRDLKIVAFTAHTEVLEKGFDGIITKPFKEKEMLAIIHKFGKPILFETSDIVKMAMGDDHLLQNNLSIFLSETNKDINELVLNLNRDNQLGVAATMHKLAGRIAQVGAISLSKILYKCEKEIIEMGTMDKTKLTNLTEEISLLVKQIERLIAKKKKSA